MPDPVPRVKAYLDVIKDACLLVSVACNVYFGFHTAQLQRTAAEFDFRAKQESTVNQKNVRELELQVKHLDFDLKRETLKPHVACRRYILPAASLRTLLSPAQSTSIEGLPRPYLVQTAFGRAVYSSVRAGETEPPDVLGTEFLCFTNSGQVPAEDLRVHGAGARGAIVLGALEPGTTKMLPVARGDRAEAIAVDSYSYAFTIAGVRSEEKKPAPERAAPSLLASASQSMIYSGYRPTERPPEKK